MRSPQLPFVGAVKPCSFNSFLGRKEAGECRRLRIARLTRIRAGCHIRANPETSALASAQKVHKQTRKHIRNETSNLYLTTLWVSTFIFDNAYFCGNHPSLEDTHPFSEYQLIYIDTADREAKTSLSASKSLKSSVWGKFCWPLKKPSFFEQV